MLHPASRSDEIDIAIPSHYAVLQMRIDASGHNFVFPHKCACCGGAADTELGASATKSSGKRVVHTKTNVWDFPYCSRCVGHVMSAEGTRTVALILGIVSVSFGLFLGFVASATSGVMIGTLAIVGTGFIYRRGMAKARARCGADCVCVGRAMAYLGWYGTLHQFEVSSPQYAHDFMKSNQSKLVNLSVQAKNLLAGSPSPKTDARTPRRYQS
jgi:hypothetical protein